MIDSLYICPWSLRDPLCQSQSLAYIRGLVGAGYKFALITFETAQHKLDGDELEGQKRELAGEGIQWYPVDWPNGNSISDKLGGIKSVILEGIKVCRRHRPRLIHSRSSLPVFAAVTLKKLFRTKFLYDADSMLSEEYVDIGHMSRGGKAQRFLAWSEKWARENADHIIVLTEKLRDNYLHELGVKAPIDVIPCCVDTDKFRFDDVARVELRAELALADEDVLMVYVGKTGSWYLIEETFRFFRLFEEICPGSKLLIVSREPADVFGKVAEKEGITPDKFFVRSAEHSDIPKWLSASDVGLSLIRQVKSKLGSSPVKFAEYLACGLPVVSTDHIGDCTTVIKEHQVGVVTADASDEELAKGAYELSRRLDGGRQSIVNRSRLTASELFSVAAAGTTAYSRIYSRFFDKKYCSEQQLSKI